MLDGGADLAGTPLTGGGGIDAVGWLVPSILLLNVQIPMGADAHGRRMPSASRAPIELKLH